MRLYLWRLRYALWRRVLSHVEAKAEGVNGHAVFSCMRLQHACHEALQQQYSDGIKALHVVVAALASPLFSMITMHSTLCASGLVHNLASKAVSQMYVYYGPVPY